MGGGEARDVTCFKKQTSSMEEGDPVTKMMWLKKECVWLAVGMIEVCKAIVDIIAVIKAGLKTG